MKKSGTRKSGFTLIELMVTILIASIGFIGIGMVLADAIRGYRQMFTRVHGDIVNDAYVARLRFDKICRGASKFDTDILYDAAVNPGEVTVFLYSDNIDPTALGLDRFARFYLSGSNMMMLDQGPAAYNDTTSLWDLEDADSTITVAQNVTELKFSVEGKSVQMTLTLFDNVKQQGLTVVCSSIRHN